ncbi:RICIN domain-containing protein [Streptomyces sp. L2]|uniref:RICIN domain-containing protein n=1 Tax=Streptomyces sp. L2 TaxID=2162665 RepID=UPI0010113BC1|nr:RICIN domain-containing protein [Streptomyces sp. L2]
MKDADASDEQLSAALKKWTGTAPALHPVGELLDRHWEAAFAYARLCTDGTRAAGMLTTAAFTRLFGESLRHSGPSAAWRPHLLVTVRRIAAEWDGDGRQNLLHPALRPTAAGERAAARLLPPAGRRMLSRAFQRLPQTARAVLWHTEVEAEPLSAPAALLGLDEEDTLAELRRARERLREECLQAHRELAPEQECLRYLRMLDVTFRRGGVDIDPDLNDHLARCRHCRRTGDQLARFESGLGLALAEAVLGWGAGAYLESRPGRSGESAGPDPRPEPAPDTPLPWGGEAFAPLAEPAATSPAAPVAPAAPGAPVGASAPRPSHRSARRAAPRPRPRRRNLALAVATVSGLVVLPLVLWSVLGSGDGPAPGPGGTPSRAPGKDTASPGPSWAGANGTAKGALRGRLHNVASGLCVAVVGKKAVKGAETELAACSSASDQQWVYEPDGLLRSAAATALCLDSHLGYSVVLADCADKDSGHAARSVRYDFTLQGALVPRWDQDLALTPAATDGSGSLVLKNRANTSVQHWTVDTAQPDLRMQIVNWDTDSGPTASPTPTPKAAPRPSASPSPTTPAPTATGRAPRPAPSPSLSGFCAAYPAYCYPGGQDGSGGTGGFGGGHGGHGGR